MSKLDNTIFDSLGKSVSLQECPRCGTTFQEYRRTTLLGCPVCYRYFRELLLPSIRKFQFRLQHEGKFPASTNLETRSRRRLSLLRQELAQAIQVENFEHAVDLRDEIKTLEELLAKEVKS